MSTSLIPAFCKGELLQRQIHRARKNGGPDAFDIWWLGQSGFLIQWNGICILFDPYLSDSLTRKYASTDKPHTRMSELVISPAQLDCVDIVTSSHNHTDHLDADTLLPLFAANPDIQFLIPEANRDFVTERVQRAFTFPIGLNDGEKIEIKGVSFHGVPSAHNTIERDELGRCRYMGYVASFGRWKVYHSGDTLWYDHMVELLKPFQVDVAFLPINGNVPARRVAGNLNAEEAARLGKEIGARLVIPHHYDLFEFNTADPHDFASAAEECQQAFVILKLGEHWSSQAMQR